MYFSPSHCVCAVSCWYIDVSRTSWIACYLIRSSSLFAYCWVWAMDSNGFWYPTSQWAHSSFDQTYMHPIGIGRKRRKEKYVAKYSFSLIGSSVFTCKEKKNGNWLVEHFRKVLLNWICCAVKTKKRFEHLNNVIGKSMHS